MKLYNIFNSLIIEEINKKRQVLTESVSVDDVKAAIDEKYNVNILWIS